MNDHELDHITHLLSLRGLLTVWPGPEMVNACCYQIERQLQAEAAEAEAEERKRLEAE